MAIKLLAFLSWVFSSIGFFPLENPARAGNWFFVKNNNAYVFANAWEFNGTDEYITVGHDATISPTTDLSVEMVVNLTSSAGFDQLITKRDTDDSGLVFQVYKDTADKLNVYLTDGSNVKLYRYDTAIAGANHQVGFTWGSTGTLKVYIDGSEATVVKTTDNAFSSLLSNTVGYGIGANPSTSSPLAGKIARCTIWLAELSAANFSTLHDSGSWGVSPMTIGTPGMSLLMEDDTTTAIDASGNGNTGTLNGLVAATDFVTF